MKPKITMDEKPAVVIATVDHGETVKATSRRKLLIVGAVIGLACVVVIAGVSIGAFYLGMNAERESYQEAWVNFEAGANKTIIKERVIVREKEAEFRRPGVMNMVVDYENNLLVMQHDRQLEEDEDIFCHVYDYEPGMFGTHQDAENIVSQNTTSVKVPDADEMFRFDGTEEHVPLEKLSPKAREMCYGAEIMRVRKKESTDGEREKRFIKCKWRFRCSRVCFIFFCKRICLKVPYSCRISFG